MTSITNADLAAIRKRAEAASPGPWDFSTYWVWRTELDGRPAKPVAFLRESPDDARFIAHSRTDIPALLDTIETLREVVAEMATTPPLGSSLHRELDRRIARARAVLARMEVAG